jgi:hypothetical protein
MGRWAPRVQHQVDGLLCQEGDQEIELGKLVSDDVDAETVLWRSLANQLACVGPECREEHQLKVSTVLAILWCLLSVRHLNSGSSVVAGISSFCYDTVKTHTSTSFTPGFLQLFSWILCSSLRPLESP